MRMRWRRFFSDSSLAARPEWMELGFSALVASVWAALATVASVLVVPALLEPVLNGSVLVASTLFVPALEESPAIPASGCATSGCSEGSSSVAKLPVDSALGDETLEASALEESPALGTLLR